MAYLVQKAKNSSSYISTLSVTLPAAATSGNCIVIAVEAGKSTDPFSIAQMAANADRIDGSTPVTPDPVLKDNLNNTFVVTERLVNFDGDLGYFSTMYLFYLANVAGGNRTFTLTLKDANGRPTFDYGVNMQVFELQNLSTTQDDGHSSALSSANPAVSSALTLTDNGDIVLLAGHIRKSASVTLPANFILLDSDRVVGTANDYFVIGHSPDGLTSGSYQPGFTNANRYRVGVATLAFKTGSTPPPPTFVLVQASDYNTTDIVPTSTGWARPTSAILWDHTSASALFAGGTNAVPQGGSFQSFVILGNTLGTVVPLPTDQSSFNTNYALLGMDKTGNIYFWSHNNSDGFDHIYKTTPDGSTLTSIVIPPSTDPVWNGSNPSYGFLFYNGATPYLAFVGTDQNGNPGALWIVNATNMTAVGSPIQLTEDPNANYNGNDIAMCTDPSGNIYVTVFNTSAQQIELYKSTLGGTVTQYLPWPTNAGVKVTALLGTQTGNLIAFLDDNSVSLLKPPFTSVFANVANIGNQGNISLENYFNYGLTAPDDTFITVGNWDGTTSPTPISLISAVDLSTEGTSSGLAAPQASTYLTYLPQISAVVQVNYSFSSAAEVSAFTF